MQNAFTDDEFIETAQYLDWTFAKTMPHIPHEYIVRHKTVDEETFITMFHTIDARGEPGDWNGTQYKYLRPGDDYKYWKMTDDLSKSVIINRAYDDSLPQPEYRSMAPKANMVLCPLVNDWIDISECDENRETRDESIPLRFMQQENWRDICNNCIWGKQYRVKKIDWEDFDKHLLRYKLYLTIGKTDITFCINAPDRHKEPKYDGDELYDWCLVSLLIKSRHFNFDVINDEMLTVGEVKALYHHLDGLLNDEVSDVRRLIFIEPDLEFMLYPRLGSAPMRKEIDRPILYDTQDISATLTIYIEDAEGYTGQSFSINLDRDNVLRLKEYLGERLQAFSGERYGELL